MASRSMEVFTLYGLAWMKQENEAQLTVVELSVRMTELAATRVLGLPLLEETPLAFLLLLQTLVSLSLLIL